MEIDRQRELERERERYKRKESGKGGYQTGSGNGESSMKFKVTGIPQQIVKILRFFPNQKFFTNNKDDFLLALYEQNLEKKYNF